ncbi:BZ3500_MvSof-1268-A1-R1_Chr1-3g02463 [Microbotryum saponariae]|uniref:RNA-directed DNA polymerase n=1 Tax=Microbotryum saponariae TaxID=289078 RepID=A0A2X0LBI3_9BASI|nr:BZ3500_MvSof-1268-A1-R1_Chr1-3g02463 [Microbotryum saponariae]SCZ96301.1 BZ3501_MvSof-1269-A2-R1_Chr1-3g02066 [Microbotryum saponariae]
MRLDYYNRRVARVPVTSDHDKIEGAGMGLQVLALKTWFSQGLSKHLAKPYAQFKSELIRRAVPADFVWTQLEVLHRQRQVTGHDVHAFQDFSDRMRVLQMEIGFQVVSDQELAKLVLLGTDPELCRLLRTHVVSSLAGWSDLSLERLALDAPAPAVVSETDVYSDAPAEQPGEFDYQVFERIGREEWGVIAQRRAAIQTFQETGDSTAFAGLNSDSEDDDYSYAPRSFPPLPVSLRGAHGTLTASALVDSGSPQTFLSEDFVQRLGFEKRALEQHTKYTLAMQNQVPTVFTCTHFVRVPVELANGRWAAGPTYAEVAPLGRDLELILGGNFIYTHKIDLGHFPHPHLTCKNNPEEPIDLLELSSQPRGTSPVAAIAPVNEDEQLRLAALDQRLRAVYADRFPDDIPPVATYQSPVRHHIELDNPRTVINLRGYPVAKRHRQAWYLLLQKHLASGRLRPSRSPYASPAFIIPKKGSDVDPTISPRWVNDYRHLNRHTIKDRTPLPLADDILSTCSKAQFWAKIDMTNSFFQTKMAEEDIAKTAVSTPWGLYEWTVMPMGLCNAPATHQRRVNDALHGLLGTICFVYLDDITIFADTLEEHEARVCQVLDALRRAELYCSPSKTNLATSECEFLGHIINRSGVHADPKKIKRIHDWHLPATVTELKGFLGLVQYLRRFIPGLAEHTAALTPLTIKGLTSIGNLWTTPTVRHFEAIKSIVVSLDCLRPPDHSADAMPFWVMTDASLQGIGGVLLQVSHWKTAHPIAYWSRQYIPAERNYPTHEQELLAIVEALKEWRIDLLGGHFHILTDHSTLEHFQTQRTVISRRQARWLDTLAEFDYDLQYLPGRENIVADAMSRYSFPEPIPVIVANISQVSLSDVVKQQIVDAYKTDAFCQQALNNIASVASEFKIIDALLYLRGRLVIPLLAPLRESILHDAHDALGHLGDVKTYQTVIQTYFWPNMSRHVKQYVQQYDSCQRTKARTTRVAGKLHSLPVPVRPMTDIAVDFVGPLPTNKGFDRVLTITDRLSGYVRLIPAREADTAADVANRFHEGWHRFFGLPQRIVSDRDKLFTSKFWSALHKRLNIKLQLSSAFHPETDGRSEKTNKTAFQILRSLVNREQSNWVECLTACEYAINSSVNVSTGKTPFELVLGYTPTLAPLAPIEGDEELPSVEELLALRFQSCEEARDQLAVSKVRQAAQANKDRADEPSWAVGDLVLLDSSDRRKRLHTRKRRAAKLMDRFDGPYRIVAAQPGISTYTLQLNKDDSAVPFFHTGKLKAYRSNDSELFPSREPARPGPVDVGGEPELNIWSLGFHGRRIAIHGSLPRHWRTRRHWTVGNIGTRNESVFSEGSFVSRRGESSEAPLSETACLSEAWAFRAKTPIYGLVRNQKKGFDLLRPEAGYDAYHFFGFGPNAEAFDRARLAHGAFIVKTPYGLAEPFEVDGQMKQGDPPNPLRFSLAMAMGSYWLDEQAFEDPLLITTQNRARSNNHTQADELTLKITQVSAMDDTILLAKSERTLAAMTLYMEHFQEAYGAQTDWGTKTRAIIMGLGNQSDTPGTVQVATPHGRRQVTVDPAHVFLKTPFAVPDRQYTQLESIVRSIGFPSTPTRRLPLSALRRFIEQQLISRLRPRLALCPIRPDDALKLDQLIAMRIKEYYGWVSHRALNGKNNAGRPTMPTPWLYIAAPEP